MKNKTTVIIKTIGRPTLKAAIRSAKDEGFQPIVVSDGAKVSAQGASRVVRLGKKWGYYGGMAANVGAAMAETEFITFLDDDDVFIKGAGDIIRGKLEEKPEVDIWIAGVRYPAPILIHGKADETGRRPLTFSGSVVALDSERGVQVGNVAMPTYRTSVFEKVPFTNVVPDDMQNITDCYHVFQCQNQGFKIDWFGAPLYEVRPHMRDKQDPVVDKYGNEINVINPQYRPRLDHFNGQGNF